MDFEPAELEEWIDAGTLEDELRMNFEKRPHLLGLMDSCDNGGSPGDVEVWEVTCSVEAGGITGIAKVAFEESRHRGCSDKQWAVKHAGAISFAIEVDTGEISILETAISNDDVKDEPGPGPDE